MDQPPQSRSSRRGGPGTRPAGARDEGEAAARVQEMFSRIAPRYDLLNHLLSFSLDRVWRWRTARRFRQVLARPDARVLDLCCGTGDLTLALERARAREARRQGSNEGKEQGPESAAGSQSHALVLGIDFVHPMLLLAQQKTRRTRGAAANRVLYVEADALKLPFADASFNLITIAFGFRNLANYERGLREMFRLLRPGGEVGILEFAEPRNSLFGPLYRFYFQRILPRVGGAISGSTETYAYLPSSVSEFPSFEELHVVMARVGFANPRGEVWTAGIVALHTGRKN